VEAMPYFFARASMPERTASWPSLSETAPAGPTGERGGNDLRPGSALLPPVFPQQLPSERIDQPDVHGS